MHQPLLRLSPYPSGNGDRKVIAPAFIHAVPLLNNGQVAVTAYEFVLSANVFKHADALFGAKLNSFLTHGRDIISEPAARPTLNRISF